MKPIYVISAVLILLIISFITSFISVKDRAAEMYTLYESAIADIENVHDNTWKKISQVAQVEKGSREDYEKYIKSFVERGDAYKGTQWVWIQENLTQKNPDLETQLIRIIEDSRDELKEANKNANHIASQFNTYRRRTFNSILLSFTKYSNDVEIKQITSTRSKQALQKGVDDSVDLY